MVQSIVNHGVIVIHGIGDNMKPGSLLADVTNSLAEALMESPEKGEKPEIRRKADLSGNPPSVILNIKNPIDKSAGGTISPWSGKEATWTCKEAFWDDAFPPPKASNVLWRLLGKNIKNQIRYVWAGFSDPGNDSYINEKDKGIENKRREAGEISPERFHYTVKTLKDIKELKGMTKEEKNSIAISTIIQAKSAPAPFWILPLAGVAYLILGFLWICQFIPSIGPLEKVLKWVHKFDPFISNSFGDVHGYMEHEVWRANARGRLEKIIIDMLRNDEIKDITIVAHSMGCVVTYDALAEGGEVAREIENLKSNLKRIPKWKPKKITFVSVGSGINQVFNLYAKEEFKRPLAEAIIQWAGVGGQKAKAPDEKFYWLDIHARRDPVPAGELETDIIKEIAQIEHDTQVKRRRVINMDSIFFDHSSYWANKDTVIPRIAKAINSGKDLWPAAGITEDKVTRRIKYAAGFRGLIKLLAQIVVSAIVAGGVVFLILQWTNVI